MKTINVTNCFVCVYRTNFKFLRFLFPLKTCCPHSESFYSETPHFSVFKPFVMSILAFSVVALLVSAFTLFRTEKLCQTDKSPYLLILGEESYVLTTAILGITTSHKVCKKLLELTTWSTIFPHCNYFGLTSIVDEKHYKRFVKKRIFLTTFTIILLVVAAVILQLSFSDDLPLTILRSFFLLCSTNFQVFMALENHTKLELGGLVLKSVKRSLLRNRKADFRQLSMLSTHDSEFKNRVNDFLNQKP